ncbi:dienelactone hydrolase family protein [Novosphingobium sediminicola]|uniref:Carboxymethylenebutenolidase n=1 Tax=Novosphingobium sediminicola TaxID=563162 RepID=A0A7W6G638_9SPHN|nr:dienelactone hydrolase family protein [Novosphingobium sediminicola]MBB3954896.1 carboxymethylenebutenolidase [Novosphingobium sediminicola]
MCDELTIADEDASAIGQGLSRRQFAALSAAGAAAALAGAEQAIAAGAALKESAVAITTPDGTCDAFFVHPANGKHPGIIVWPDIAGSRDAYKVMARRLASDGYAVLLVNHYYRTAKAPLLATMAEWRTPAGGEKLKPAIAAITTPGIISDSKAFVGWLDKQAAVDAKRKIGSAGYCMTGSYTVRTAAANPDRVTACASFHGGGLVSEAPDSPHKLIAATKAGFLFAIGKNDDARSPGDKDALKAAAAAAGRPAEVEVYNADHGWCTLDGATYNKEEADRAYARQLALFAKL